MLHRNNGDLRASSAVVKDAEKFDLTYHEAGSPSGLEYFLAEVSPRPPGHNMFYLKKNMFFCIQP